MPVARSAKSKSLAGDAFEACTSTLYVSNVSPTYAGIFCSLRRYPRYIRGSASTHAPRTGLAVPLLRKAEPMSDKTPAQLAHEEQQNIVAAILDAGLPLVSESNVMIENNVEDHEADSQGIEGSLARRAVPDASFNENTYNAYEEYDDSDAFASVEEWKRTGTVSYDGGGGY